jgi:hypothetical protein
VPGQPGGAGLPGLTGENVLVAVLALVLWPLPFQPLVQVLHLLLLQTLRDESGNEQWSTVDFMEQISVRGR